MLNVDPLGWQGKAEEKQKFRSPQIGYYSKKKKKKTLNMLVFYYVTSLVIAVICVCAWFIGWLKFSIRTLPQGIYSAVVSVCIIGAVAWSDLHFPLCWAAESCMSPISAVNSCSRHLVMLLAISCQIQIVAWSQESLPSLLFFTASIPNLSGITAWLPMSCMDSVTFRGILIHTPFSQKTWIVSRYILLFSLFYC